MDVTFNTDKLTLNILVLDELDRVRSAEILNALLPVIGTNHIQYSGQEFYFKISPIATSNYSAAQQDPGRYSGLSLMGEALKRRFIVRHEMTPNEALEAFVLRSLFENHVADTDRIVKFVATLREHQAEGKLRNLGEITLYNMIGTMELMVLGWPAAEAIKSTILGGLPRQDEDHLLVIDELDRFYPSDSRRGTLLNPYARRQFR
jgi:hypothetical protein